ncbi:MAG: hypothetical protein ACLPWS_04110 [Rhodomicrobium sp.]
MKKRGAAFNPKRKLAAADHWTPIQRTSHASRARYGGNPEHKRNPGDYGLTPPASPRPGKTLCDADQPLLKAEAERLLKDGLRKGMISQRESGTWPQNVWAVSDDGQVFEAQLENEVQGIYHGYPLQVNDDFRATVLSEWPKR